MKKRRRTTVTIAPMYLMTSPPSQADFTTNFSDISLRIAIDPNLLHSQEVISGDVSTTLQNAGSQAPFVPKSGFHQTHWRTSTPSLSMSECHNKFRLTMRAFITCLWYSTTLQFYIQVFQLHHFNVSSTYPYGKISCVPRTSNFGNTAF